MVARSVSLTLPLFAGAQRRLILSYAAVVTATLLLFGPILYVQFSGQLTAAFNQTLRLATQRQAGLALVPTGVALGINPNFQAPPSLADRDAFFVLLTPDGDVTSNPSGVTHAGLPDQQAAQQAARQGHGVLSDLHTADAGDFRLYTAVIKRNGVVVALLQGGRSLDALTSARHDLLYLLLALGAGTVVIAAAGGFLLTREAMRPITAAFSAQRAFVADASHELRTPLTLIRTNAEVLLEASAVPDPEDRALIEDIVAEAEHMGRLVADLLTLARLDAGALIRARDPVDLAAVVAAATRQMARLATRRGIAVRQGETAAATVQGDAGRLEQVALILLDNAVKYTTVGGEVEVTLRREGQRALLAVRDTGPGIPDAEIPRLFARFHRASASAAGTEGHGLGLAIAEGIVRAHRGHLRVRSTVGVGSTFEVGLPLAGSQAMAIPARRATAPVAPPPLDGREEGR